MYRLVCCDLDFPTLDLFYRTFKLIYCLCTTWKTSAFFLSILGETTVWETKKKLLPPTKQFSCHDINHFKRIRQCTTRAQTNVWYLSHNETVPLFEEASCKSVFLTLIHWQQKLMGGFYAMNSFPRCGELFIQ